jgi:hypothetical protein
VVVVLLLVVVATEVVVSPVADVEVVDVGSVTAIVEVSAVDAVDAVCVLRDALFLPRTVGSSLSSRLVALERTVAVKDEPSSHPPPHPAIRSENTSGPRCCQQSVCRRWESFVERVISS